MDDGPRDDRRPVSRVLGKVIKGDAVPEASPERAAARSGRPGVLNAEEFEARHGAQQVVLEAKKQAEELLEEARRQREEVFAKARDDARAEVTAQAATEIAKAKMQAGQILAAAERDIVELACRVAEKIIGRDLERQPETIVDICATAIESMRRAKALVLRVNPRDAAVLREKTPKLMEMVGRNSDLAIKDDRDVEPGGCVLQTEFGTVDAQLRTQFEMLRLVLLPDTARKEVK